MKQFIENIRRMLLYATSPFFLFSFIIIAIVVGVGITGLIMYVLVSLFGVYGVLPGAISLPLARIVYAGVTGK